MARKPRRHKIFQPDADLDAETAPIATGPLFTQRLSSVVGLVRDRAILDTITMELNRQRSVLVVYGSSHFSTQSRALHAMLGPPLETFGLPLR